MTQAIAPQNKAVGNTSLLEARSICVRERISGRLLVNNVSLAIEAGSCLGIVGESGSGKSLLCRALLGLLPKGLAASGTVLFEGRDVLSLSERERRALRGAGISFVAQQAMTAYDPLLTLGRQITALFRDRLRLGRNEAHDLACTTLARVGLEAQVLDRYPHELSGGQMQRCMIATSLGLGSRLVIADEPTTALDAKSQYEVLLALKTLVRERGTALILVSHDLGAVQMLAEHVLVLNGGYCVESGLAWQVFNAPRHKVTRALVRTRADLSARFAHHGGTA